MSQNNSDNKYVFDPDDLPTTDGTEKGISRWDELENILGKSKEKDKWNQSGSGQIDPPIKDDAPTKEKEVLTSPEGEGIGSSEFFPEDIDPVEAISIDEYPQLDLSRTLTDDEYLDLLADLNEDAENKNYVFIFGLPGSGKSFIIASLLKYMEQCDLGQSRLDVDQSTVTERKLYNRMIMSFTDPKNHKIESNATLDFNRFNIVFTPKGNKPEKTITFLDVSGEACQAIYQGDSSKYTGELPDFLRVVLESDINSTFLLVGEYQDPKAKNEHAMQDQILKAFYDKILDIQSKEKRKYHKILLISKWDRLSTSERDDMSVVEYAKKCLPATWNNFRVENHHGSVVNAITHYSVGEFKSDRLMKINIERPEVLFDSIYEGITGQPLKKPEPFYKKAMKYLMGSN